MRCLKCLKDIADSTAFWKFDETGCGHTLCSQCFTSFALDVKKECPCCHVIPHSIVHSYFIWHGRGIHKRLIKKNHTSTLAHMESANLLTISVLDELPITVSLKAPSHDEDDDPQNYEQTKKLQESKMSFIFSKLKPLLNPTRKQKRNKRSSDSYDLDEIGEGSDYFEKLNYLIEK